MRERALFLTPAPPSPTGNGLSQRCFLFLRALARRFDVTVLVLPVAQRHIEIGNVLRSEAGWPDGETIKLDYRSLQEVPARSSHFTLISRVSDPPQRSAAFALFGRPSLCAGLTRDCLRICADALHGERFAHIHVMRAYCAPFAAEVAPHVSDTNPPVLTLDLDEDDAAFHLMLADHHDAKDDGPKDRGAVAWQRQEAAAFRNIQETGLSDYQALFASSAPEAERLSMATGKRIELAPNVAHCPIVEPELRDPLAERTSSRRLVFVGNFGHVPNANGLDWFLEDMWPELKRRLGGIRLTLVGQNPPHNDTLTEDPHIEVTGAVDSVVPHYRAADLAVAPLRLGAGTRIKLLEAARLGVPFVATPIAAEGLGMLDRQHCWLANSASAFVESVVEALEYPEKRLAVARNAQELALTKNTVEQVEQGLVARLTKLHP